MVSFVQYMSIHFGRPIILYLHHDTRNNPGRKWPERANVPAVTQ